MRKLISDGKEGKIYQALNMSMKLVAENTFLFVKQHFYNQKAFLQEYLKKFEAIKMAKCPFSWIDLNWNLKHFSGAKKLLCLDKNTEKQKIMN